MNSSSHHFQRIFILGSGGRLGQALVKNWSQKKGVEIISFSRMELDYSDDKEVLQKISSFNLSEGDLLVNAAALTNVDLCETEESLAYQVNATTPGKLAQLATQRGARFLHISTDYVFDGEKETPYHENDPTLPLSIYGKSKLLGEELVLSSSLNHLVVRVSWVFGPDRPSFIDFIINQALTSKPISAIANKYSSPSYTKDLAEWIFFLKEPHHPGGVYHLCNQGICSWHEYALKALEELTILGKIPFLPSVVPLKLEDFPNFIAPRPPQTALDCSKFERLYGLKLTPWTEALHHYIQQQAPFYSFQS